jgi:hypothetical protein
MNCHNIKKRIINLQANLLNYKNYTIIDKVISKTVIKINGKITKGRLIIGNYKQKISKK